MEPLKFIAEDSLNIQEGLDGVKAQLDSYIEKLSVLVAGENVPELTNVSHLKACADLALSHLLGCKDRLEKVVSTYSEAFPK